MYEEISISLSAVSTVASVIQALPIIIGNRTSRVNWKSNTKRIAIAQGLLFFGAFVAVLPTIVQIIIYNHSLNPNAGFMEQYKFSSQDWYRIAWGMFIFLGVVPWLSRFKDNEN